MCNPIEVGGLGIKNIAKFNLALLAKWKWRIGLDEVGVWKDIVQSRYGSWRDMSSNRLDKRHSRWWRDLCKICDVDNQNNWFDQRVSWQLGDGRKIRFWDDKWVGDQALKLKYPRLYLLLTCKESIIDDVRERGTSENGKHFHGN